MTCREKLAKERPDSVNDKYLGGCNGCPRTWGYLPDPPYCKCHEDGKKIAYHEICSACWDREIPGTGFDYLISDLSMVKTNNTPHILDSGNRREFETGAVRDIQEGKGRCDLMPLDVVSYYLDDDDIIDSINEFITCNDIDMLKTALEQFVYTRWFDEYNISNGDFGLSPLQVHKSHYHMLLEVAKHFEDGAKKYGENNWQKGIPVRCYIDSAVRHYLKYLRGDKDESHDRAFCWNILCAIWTCKHKPELNDYKKSEVSLSTVL